MGLDKDNGLAKKTGQRGRAGDRPAIENGLPLPRTAEEILQLIAELENCWIERELSRLIDAKLHDLAPIGYFTFDARGHIRKINPAGAQLLGIGSEAPIDRPFADFIADEAGKAVFREHLAAVLHNQGIQRCEISLAKNDGAAISGRLRSVRVEPDEDRDGVVLCAIIDASAGKGREDELQQAHDDLELIVHERTRELTRANARLSQEIEERRQAEAALKENETRLSTVLEAVKEGITFSDEKGHFVAYNSEMERLTGYSAEEANAVSDYTTILYPDARDRAEALAGLNELTAIGMAREAEARIRTKDGKQKYVLVSTILIPYKDQRMFLSSYHDITERKQLEEELRTLSIIDELTGLSNRRGFLTLAEQQLKLAERTGMSVVLLFLDLDYMKWINDTWGHREGDAALVEVAAVLRQTFRKSDIVGRIGGDEFAILAIDTADEVRKTVARLRETIDSHNQPATRRYRLALSVGSACFDPDAPSSLDELIAIADNQMYEEKKTKRRH